MDNREQAKELTNKLTQIQLEIDDKNQKITVLRQENSKLIEQNLHKERKPPSLRLGREKIFELNNEIEEMELTRISLQERLESANSAIRKEQLKGKISQFQESSKDQLALVENVRRNVKASEISISALEKSSGKRHAIYALLNLCWDYPDTKKEINLDNVLSDWAPDKVVIDVVFDDLMKRLDRLRVDTTNFWNQLAALRENKRSYHKVEPVRKDNPPLASDSFVSIQQAGKEAEKVRQQPARRYINHNVVAHVG